MTTNLTDVASTKWPLATVNVRMLTHRAALRVILIIHGEFEFKLKTSAGYKVYKWVYVFVFNFILFVFVLVI